jgi:hypothetical protein
VTKAPDPKLSEAGRKGGIASGEARRKRRSRSFLDALRDRVSSNPDELVDQLVGTAAGAVVAARVLERAGDFEKPEQPEPSSKTPFGSSFPLGDVIRIAVETKQELLLLGFELTPEQRRQVLEAGDGATPPVSAQLRDRLPVGAERAIGSTGDAEAVDAKGGGGAPEIDPSHVSSGSGESRVPKPRPRYSDPRAQEIYESRLRVGLPTGGRDVYVDPRDER